MRKKSGFTLVELMIVISLTAILTGVIFEIYQKNNSSYALMNTKTSLYEDNLTALDFIRSDIKKSHRVLTSYSTYATTDNSIILEIPELDTAKVPIANSYYYVIYKPDDSSKKLERIEIIDTVATTKIINDKLSSLTFTIMDNASITLPVSNLNTAAQIKIDLKLQDKSRNTLVNSYLTSTETMRNK